MDLKGIISISGRPGLSKIISQSRGGLIVEALDDNKRFAVHGAERVSALEDISIYTHEEDLLLTDVFELILKASDGKTILSHKSNAEELKTYLKEVLPNYDEERVYNSDIKKIVQWYNILIEKKILSLEKPKKEKTKSKSETSGEPKKKKAVAKKKGKPKSEKKSAK